MRKNVKTTRGRPFPPGNAGRPKGARNKATLACETLLDGEAEALTRKAIDLALQGDTTAMRLCMERICPPKKERPLSLIIPAVATVEDVVTALGVTLGAVANGEIMPSEGVALAGLLEVKRKALETLDLERRIAALETTNGHKS